MCRSSLGICERNLMKKTKKSFDGEQDDSGLSKNLGIFSEEEGLDDDIIDLEDIIELGLAEKPASLDADEEILDADGELDLSALDTDQDDREGDTLEADLLREFGFDETVEAKPHLEEENRSPGMGKGGNIHPGTFRKEEAASLERVDSDLGFLSNDGEKDEFQKLLEMGDDKKVGSTGGERLPAALEPEKAGASPREKVPATTELSESRDLDKLIDQIESKLTQTVREIVEARLPDIVRTLLREEIEKLKKDLF